MNPAPALALISHRFANIGHTFMSVGMEEIAHEAFGRDVRIVHFEQHRFFDQHPWYHPLRLLDFVPHGRLKDLRFALGKERACRLLWPQASDLREFSLAVNCGGPSLSPGVGASPEMRLMYLFKQGAFTHQGIPTLDLGVGSGAFPLERPAGSAHQVFSELDRDYLRRLFAYTTLTTVRDPLAFRLMKELGRDAPLIPCAALISGRRMARFAAPTVAESDRLVLINFQRVGANEDWGQGVDAEKWAATVKDLIKRMSVRHRIAFLCHNKLEAKLAERLAPELPRHLPETVEAYGRLITQAKVGLVSRVHAAIPLAGVGVPSLVIGTDSRLGTLELMGLPTLYVKQATAEGLETTLESLIKKGTTERERLLALREDTAARYARLFRKHALPGGRS